MGTLPVILVVLAAFVATRLAWMAAFPAARQITPRPSGRRVAVPRHSGSR